MKPSIIVCCVALSITVYGCGSGGWNHKATTDEKRASELVGGFTDDDKMLYHQGLLHLNNLRRHPGQYTIGQVIDQERNREVKRTEIKADASITRKENAAWSEYHKDLLEVNSTTNEALVRNARSTDRGVVVTVDGDIYENLSEQDQHQIDHIIRDAWVGAVSHHLSSGEVPELWKVVRVENMAGDRLFSDDVDWK